MVGGEQTNESTQLSNDLLALIGVSSGHPVGIVLGVSVKAYGMAKKSSSTLESSLSRAFGESMERAAEVASKHVIRSSARGLRTRTSGWTKKHLGRGTWWPYQSTSNRLARYFVGDVGAMGLPQLVEEHGWALNQLEHDELLANQFKKVIENSVVPAEAVVVSDKRELTVQDQDDDRFVEGLSQLILLEACRNHREVLAFDPTFVSSRDDRLDAQSWALRAAEIMYSRIRSDPSLQTIRELLTDERKIRLDQAQLAALDQIAHSSASTAIGTGRVRKATLTVVAILLLWGGGDVLNIPVLDDFDSAISWIAERIDDAPSQIELDESDSSTS